LALVAAFAEQIATHDPLAQDIPNALLPPGADGHWFGADRFGRDVFSRVVYGARVSLYVGLVSVLVGTSIGVLLGVVSGYWGGRFDLLLQRFVDTLLAFPSLVLALILVAAVGPSVEGVIAAVVLAFTPQIVRLARSQALAVVGESYVMAAQAMGAGPVRIVLRHILPNSIAPVLVHATGFLEGAVVAEASLSFLGLGIPPPYPSWGRMLQEGAGAGYLEAAPWLVIFPGVALSLTVFAVAVLGDALRDVLDPRLRSP
jgi:peptide/nickel transport system permease protein